MYYLLARILFLVFVFHHNILHASFMECDLKYWHDHIEKDGALHIIHSLPMRRHLLNPHHIDEAERAIRSVSTVIKGNPKRLENLHIYGYIEHIPQKNEYLQQTIFKSP